MLMKVIEIKAVAPFGIRMRFNDGSSAVHDCSKDIAGPGPLFKQLKDPAYFARVFLDYGAPTWPNGIDMCADWLHMEMVAAGEIQRGVAKRYGVANMPKPTIFTVTAAWDSDASVWSGHCDDIPAAADAATLDELFVKISAIAQDLLPDNHPGVDPANVYLQLTALREVQLAAA